MIFCCHRINSIYELKKIPKEYGIEIDLRHDKWGNIYLSHDVYTDDDSILGFGERFEYFLKFYSHRFIILNIKSEGIEFNVREMLNDYGITDYFFLDSSFPMIYKLSKLGEKNMAVRFSEFEDINTVLNMKGKVDWVWVDCFTKNPLDKSKYRTLKKAGFRICFVSPELQNQPDKITEYVNYFKKENIVLDMVCAKQRNICYYQNKIQIIIPMSGAGQRFVDAGYSVPKPLIEIDEKPMIEHVVGIFGDETDISFICNEKHLSETSMRTVLNNIFPHCKIYKTPINGREGPVHAVSLIYDEIADDKEVIVSYCDYGTYWDYNDFLRDCRNRNADGAIACYRGFHPHMLGTDNYAFLKETTEGSRWMEAIQEKQPFTNNRMNEYASNGTYYFKSGAILKKYFKRLMERGIKVNNEYYVSMAYNLLVEDGLSVNIFEIENMLQWGTPKDVEIYRGWSQYFINIMKKQGEVTDNYKTTLILPMAGAGSRFSKKNYKDPKPLIDVNGLPMIVQAVNCLPTTEKKVFICLEEHCEKYGLKEKLQSSWKNTDVFSIPEVTQGQACTCEIAIENTNIGENDAILISACDNGVYYDVEKYQKLLDDPEVDIIVWSFRNNPASRNNPNMYAWMQTDQHDYVTDVSCKLFDPEIHDLKTSHVIIGTMFFKKARYFTEGLQENYNNNQRTNGEFYVDDVIGVNIRQGLRVKVFEVEHYICWGTPDDYETYNYWRNFFDKCLWHPYEKKRDITCGC